MNQRQSLLSNLFPSRTSAIVAEVVFIIFGGAFAAIVHHYVKVPMNLPGKQGLFFMFVLASLSTVSGFRIAGGLTTLGASLFMLAIPGPAHDPFKPIIIFLLGFVLDAMLFTAKRNRKPAIFLVAIAGSLAWAMIPLSRIIISMFTEMTYKSFATGALYPILTHMLFGFTGALLAAIVFRKIRV